MEQSSSSQVDQIFQRYEELRRYVGWTDDDGHRVQALSNAMESHWLPLIDDFYAEIERHPEARKVITGGPAQIERLKGTLVQWLRELFSGRYDREYVARRWRVGLRHVEIGLNQLYTNVALSRLRSGLVQAVSTGWTHTPGELASTIRSLNKLIDLDLAIIEDAYQAEYVARQQRVERLAAIGQVAGGVAHELRNPLNVVKTSAYFLLNARDPRPEKIKEHLQRIDHQVGMADGVITALSSFAKMPLPDLRPFAVDRCVRDALEANPLPGNIQVELDFPAELPTALGDADQLRIVFANLIRNARDAMPQGGELSIQGRNVSSSLDVAVRDTGTGIAPENLSRVMEPLFSTKVRGLGLGLALARAIVEKSRGSMTVASELGRGSTFTVRLMTESGREPSRDSGPSLPNDG